MRLLHLAVAAVVGLTLTGCSCKSSVGDDGGLDGGFDAGPKHCAVHADCASEGANFVCDPQEKVCVPKCTMDSQCTNVADGVCEKFDGTCRPLCTATTGDYCPDLS